LLGFGGAPKNISPNERPIVDDWGIAHYPFEKPTGF